MLFSSWLEEGGELESYCLESAIGSLLCTIFVLIVVDCNMKLYQVPEELRRQKIGKVLAMDYRAVGRQMMEDFKKYVNEVNEQALLALVRSR